MSEPVCDKGDVVVVDVPYLDASRSFRRPALVVADTSQMLDTIIAAISSRIRSPLPAVHYVIDEHHRDWTTSGLRLESVVRCDRLFTIHDSQIHRTIGRLSPDTIAEIDEVLWRAFGLS